MAQAASNGRPAKKARQEDDVVSRLEELDRLQNELERFNDEVSVGDAEPPARDVGVACSPCGRLGRSRDPDG